MKKLFAAALALMMALSLTACRTIDMGRVTGSWTLSTIDGKTVGEYAGALSVDVSQAAVNVTVTETEYTTSNINETATYPIKATGNGFEVLKSEGGEKIMTVMFDSKADTLAYSVSVDGTVSEYILTRA